MIRPTELDKDLARGDVRVVEQITRGGETRALAIVRGTGEWRAYPDATTTLLTGELWSCAPTRDQVLRLCWGDGGAA